MHIHTHMYTYMYICMYAYIHMFFLYEHANALKQILQNLNVDSPKDAWILAHVPFHVLQDVYTFTYSRLANIALNDLEAEILFVDYLGLLQFRRAFPITFAPSSRVIAQAAKISCRGIQATERTAAPRAALPRAVQPRCPPGWSRLSLSLVSSPCTCPA